MARRITVTPGQLILLTSVYVVVALNGTFWTKLVAVIQPTGAMDYLFVAAFAATLTALLDALAPREQTHVPMIMWASSSTQPRLGLDMECTQEVAAAKALSHDNLFHTVLGMFAVRTHLYDQRLDILQRCRTPCTSRT